MNIICPLVAYGRVCSLCLVLGCVRLSFVCAFGLCHIHNYVKYCFFLHSNLKALRSSGLLSGTHFDANLATSYPPSSTSRLANHLSKPIGTLYSWSLRSTGGLGFVISTWGYVCTSHKNRRCLDNIHVAYCHNCSFMMVYGMVHRNPFLWISL